MRFSFFVYSKAPLATFCSLLGMSLLISGIYALFLAWIAGAFVLFVIGVLLLWLSPKIAKRTVNKKLEMSLNDPKLIQRIQHSAVDAYSLFMNAPTISMLQYLQQHNPKAAKLIAAKQAGHMTEEELIWELRSIDGIPIQQGSDKQPPSGKAYTNEMFQLKNVRTMNEQADEIRIKFSKQKKRSRAWLSICVPVFLVSLTVLIVCLVLAKSTTQEREAQDAYTAKTGDYTQVKTDAIKQYKRANGYVYFDAELNAFRQVKFRISETELDQLEAVFRSDRNDASAWRTSTKPVSVYGVVRDIDGTPILEGSLEPEQEKHLNAPKPWTGLALLLVISSGICLAVFGTKYGEAKKILDSRALTS